jgi:integrase
VTQIQTDQYVADFFQHLEDHYRYNTTRNYKYAVLDFLQYLESTHTTLEISQDQIFETADKIKQGYYQSTELHAVKTNGVPRFLEYIGKQLSSKEQELIDQLSTMIQYGKVTSDKQDNAIPKQEIEKKLLTEDEIQAIEEQAGLYELTVFKLSLDTGCRIGEIAAAQPSDYNFDPDLDGTDCILKITKTFVAGLGIQPVPKKKDSRRAVEPTHETAELLQDYIDLETSQDDQLLFGTAQTMRRRLTNTVIEAGVRTYIDEDGELETRFTPHWLRHHAATELVNNPELKDRDIMQYMGWGNRDMIDRYKEIDENDVVGIRK